jgi:hypothetical protein
MPEPDAPQRRCYVIKPQWTDGGQPCRPNIVTLPATPGFGLDRDPREKTSPRPHPHAEPRRRVGPWRWRK